MKPRYDADNIDRLACELAEQRARVETELMGAIFSDPARGIEAAERAGITRDSFHHDDLRLIFIAVDFLRAFDKPLIVRVTGKFLASEGYWDETDRRSFARSMIWNPASLDSLANSYPGPVAVAMLARQLHRLDWRQREARRACRRMVEALDGRLEPNDGPAEPRKHRVVFSPARRKGRIYV